MKKLESLKSGKFQTLNEANMSQVRGGTAPGGSGSVSTAPVGTAPVNTTSSIVYSYGLGAGMAEVITDRNVDNTCWEFLKNGVLM